MIANRHLIFNIFLPCPFCGISSFTLLHALFTVQSPQSSRTQLSELSVKGQVIKAFLAMCLP